MTTQPSVRGTFRPRLPYNSLHNHLYPLFFLQRSICKRPSSSASQMVLPAANWVSTLRGRETALGAKRGVSARFSNLFLFSSLLEADGAGDGERTRSTAGCFFAAERPGASSLSWRRGCFHLLSVFFVLGASASSSSLIRGCLPLPLVFFATGACATSSSSSL